MVSDIDGKLKAIDYTMTTRVLTDAPDIEGTIVEQRLRLKTLAIEKIKQAFYEAGWHEPLSSERLARDALKAQEWRMTGQEWYERFEKEMQNAAFSVGTNNDTLYAANKCREIVRRAAGLGE